MLFVPLDCIDTPSEALQPLKLSHFFAVDARVIPRYGVSGS